MSKKPRMPNRCTHPHLEDSNQKPLPFELREWEVVLGDMRGSEVCHIQNCAGARALRRYPQVADAWVGKTIVVIQYTNGRLIKYFACAKTTEAVRQYDATSLFPPGVYRLRHMTPGNRLGDRDRLYAKSGTHAADRNDPERIRKPVLRSFR